MFKCCYVGLLFEYNSSRSQRTMSSTSTLINRGDDPLSAFTAETTPPSTTPRLPKLEDIARASLDYAHSYNGSLGGNQQDDLEALHSISVASPDTSLPKRRKVEPEEPSAGFEAPTKVEKTMMVSSIGLVLLVSVAAGLTTVCDWVL